MVLSPFFVPAYAKINLTLEVLGKRHDGYHELASIMQTVSLRDEILVSPDESDSATCITDVPELNTPDNLALRAAQLLLPLRLGAHDGAQIVLQKNVPVQAGLGGGSSDGASVLLSLTRAWNLHLSAHQLLELATKLGSDVPFFLTGGTALVSGRGEHVRPLPDMRPFWVVIAKPDKALSTAEVFRTLDPVEYTDGQVSDRFAAVISDERRAPFELVHNSLELAACKLVPEVSSLMLAMKRAGAQTVCMSGSGSAIFAPFEDIRNARATFSNIIAEGVNAWLARSVSRVEFMHMHAAMQEVS